MQNIELRQVISALLTMGSVSESEEKKVIVGLKYEIDSHCEI